MFNTFSKKVFHSLVNSSKLNKHIINNQVNNKFKKIQFSHLNKFICKISNSNFCKINKNQSQVEEEKDKEVKVSDKIDKSENKKNTNKDSEPEQTEPLSEKELAKQKRLKEMMATLTEEEFLAIQETNKEYIIMEIKAKNYNYLLRAKRIALIINLPLSVILAFSLENIFGEIPEADITKLVAYYLTIIFDYFLFFNGVFILTGLRNFVLLAKYLPKDKMMEFTKLNWYCKKYTVKESAENLRRMPRMPFTPFVSLRSKKNQEFSMNGIADWKNIKLYNYLFPIPQKIKRKKESSASLLDK